MRWKPEELLYELELDPRRRILFVEGDRDIAFWRDTVPLQKGPDVVIYPISFLECEAGEGGERGRLIRAARRLLNTPAAPRIRLFADANGDPFLGKIPPPNVTFTDGRDLESYAISSRCLDHICKTAFPAKGETAAGLLKLLREVARPIGMLRIASERAGLNLPFQRTLRENRGVNRFMKMVDGFPNLDIPRLLTTLIQNSGQSLAMLVSAMQAYEKECLTLTMIPDHKIIQGKDLIQVLAWYFSVRPDEMTRLLFMSLALESEQVRNCENIRLLQDWMLRFP
jgi:hypothetical protein